MKEKPKHPTRSQALLDLERTNTKDNSQVPEWKRIVNPETGNAIKTVKNNQNEVFKHRATHPPRERSNSPGFIDCPDVPPLV